MQHIAPFNPGSSRSKLFAPDHLSVWYDYGNQLNTIAAGTHVVTVSGSATFAPAQSLADGSYGRITHTADNERVQAVESRADVVLGLGAAVLVTACFRASVIDAIEIFAGLVVRGDTSINGNTDFATDLVGFHIVDGNASINLAHGRNAGAIANYTVNDLGVDLVADDWVSLGLLIEMDAVTAGAGRVQVYYDQGDNINLLNPQPIQTYNLTGLPYDEPLALGFGAVSGGGADTVDLAWLGRSGPNVKRNTSSWS